MTTLGDMIKAFYHENQRDDALDEQRILDSWKVVVGDFIAAHTLKTSIRNGVFYVKVDADSLKNELLYAKSMLVFKVCAAMKSPTISFHESRIRCSSKALSL